MFIITPDFIRRLNSLGYNHLKESNWVRNLALVRYGVDLFSNFIQSEADRINDILELSDSVS